MKKLINDLQKKYFEIIQEKGKGPLYKDGWMKLIYHIEKNEIRFQIDNESVRSNKYKSFYVPICFQVQKIEDIKEGIKLFYTNKRVIDFITKTSNKDSIILDKRYANFSPEDLKALYDYIKV